jgi:hypothetical protein
MVTWPCCFGLMVAESIMVGVWLGNAARVMAAMKQREERNQDSNIPFNCMSQVTVT